jgi:FAD/FMN-containing dehydrogenase
MGNSQSIFGHACFLAAVSNDASRVAFRGSLQLPPVYNLDIPVVPAAITYPKSTDEVADIVRCAVQHDYKVQARSGGHSYANHGMSHLYSPLLLASNKI